MTVLENKPLGLYPKGNSEPHEEIRLVCMTGTIAKTDSRRSVWEQALCLSQWDGLSHILLPANRTESFCPTSVRHATTPASPKPPELEN